jgi:hypothetical protein
MMSPRMTPQSSNLSAFRPNSTWKEAYRLREESSAVVPMFFDSVNDSMISAPLSDSEISDLEESNREYIEGRLEVFDNIEDFFRDLGESRNGYLEEPQE